MSILLNINLTKSHRYGDVGKLSLDDILPYLDNIRGFDVIDYFVSNKEVLIVHMESQDDLVKTPIFKQLKQLANLLKQDCISVFNTDTGEGTYIGRFASLYGEFNKATFLIK